MFTVDFAHVIVHECGCLLVVNASTHTCFHTFYDDVMDCCCALNLLCVYDYLHSNVFVLICGYVLNKAKKQKQKNGRSSNKCYIRALVCIHVSSSPRPCFILLKLLPSCCFLLLFSCTPRLLASRVLKALQTSFFLHHHFFLPPRHKEETHCQRMPFHVLPRSVSNSRKGW